MRPAPPWPCPPRCAICEGTHYTKYCPGTDFGHDHAEPEEITKPETPEAKARDGETKATR